MPDPPEFSSIALQTGDDANYAVVGDALDGTPVKITPSLGVVKQWARPSRQEAAQHMNWLMNQFGKISKALIVAVDALIHPCANLAALTAITTPGDKTIRFVYGFGVYIFDAASALAVDNVWVLAADDATTGKWVRLGNSILAGNKTVSGFARVYGEIFFTSGTFVVPADVHVVTVTMWGGGGGAGSGCGGDTSGTNYASSGSGGGAAIPTTLDIGVTPGASIAVGIGAGGAPGAQSILTGPGGDGSNGGDSSFGPVVARGGTGGIGGIAGSTPSTYMIAPGGCPVPGGFMSAGEIDDFGLALLMMGAYPGRGGHGIDKRFGVGTGFPGADSPQGKAGGAPGSHGANSGAYKGGGGGGGGAAGPGGPGGAGGAGGAGAVAADGGDGVDAGANSGAGGGGGGGGGSLTIIGTKGGHAGRGGSGQVSVTYVK